MRLTPQHHRISSPDDSYQDIIGGRKTFAFTHDTCEIDDLVTIQEIGKDGLPTGRETVLRVGSILRPETIRSLPDHCVLSLLPRLDKDATPGERLLRVVKSSGQRATEGSLAAFGLISLIVALAIMILSTILLVAWEAPVLMLGVALGVYLGSLYRTFKNW